jgi:hypothetical protein
MSGFEDFDAMFRNEGVESPAAEVEHVAQPVQTAPPVQNTPVQTATPAVQQRNEVQGVPDDFEIDMPAELQQSLEDMGIVVGDIGTKVSKVPIEKYKASSAKVDRISFLTKKVIATKFHYIQDVGSIICFGGKCCEVGGTPQVRYLFPIAVYQTDSEGNVSGKKVELKILAAGEDLYKSIMTINNGTKQYGGIDHADLLVTCTDDKFQKISLTFAGAAIWRKYPQIVEFLSSRWKKDGANAYMAVARKCDEASLMKLMGLEDGAVPMAQETFDATQNADLSKFFED